MNKNQLNIYGFLDDPEYSSNNTVKDCSILLFNLEEKTGG